MSNKVILYLKNPKNGKTKICPYGFSWTMLVFGVFLPFFREDWKFALIFTPLWFITFGIIQIPCAFIYNQMYIKSLFKDNYNLLYFKGEIDRDILNELKNPEEKISPVDI